MVMLETATLLFGIGLSSVTVADTPMNSMEECQAYLQVQASRYQMFLKPGTTRLEISYRKLGSDFLVTRTCLSY